MVDCNFIIDEVADNYNDVEITAAKIVQAKDKIKKDTKGHWSKIRESIDRKQFLESIYSQIDIIVEGKTKYFKDSLDQKDVQIKILQLEVENLKHKIEDLKKIAELEISFPES